MQTLWFHNRNQLVLLNIGFCFNVVKTKYCNGIDQLKGPIPSMSFYIINQNPLIQYK